ncbi:MAG: hypothetical protein FWG85_04965 [Bacteroidetes bacterium]|nr:hypothetical protein [Bacteroidota bacterium]
MKCSKILLLFLLLLSACAFIKDNDEGEYKVTEGGYYVLKDMSESQLKKLAEEVGLSFDTLLKKQEEGYNYKGNKDGHSFGRSTSGINGPFDPICIVKTIMQGTQGATKSCLEKPELLVIVTPNPTSSNVSVKLLSCIVEIWGHSKIFPMPVDFQLLFNEKIIHKWTNNYCNEIEIIPEEYLKESGTYLLVCNFIGSTGCTASVSASFMVIKK